MTDREKLMTFIMNLTPEQVDKIASRLPLIKQVLAMTDGEAEYTQVFTGKLFKLTTQE